MYRRLSTMTIKNQLLYVFILLVKVCHGFELIYEENNNLEINKCVAMIIQRIELVKTTDVTLINTNVELVKELHSLQSPVRFISRTFYWPNDTLFNDVYVIRCEDFFVFLQALDLVRRDPFWNPRAKFVIIIEEPEEFLQLISETLVDNYVYNVALVTYSDDRRILVYSFGHHHDDCDRPLDKMLKLRSQCSEIHNIEIDGIFTSSNKPKIRGCLVKFVSHNYWPFLSFDRSDAVENYLLRLLKQYENITVDLVDFGKVESFGKRLENFTYTGMLHEIETYNVEGAIGGFTLTFNRMSNLDFIDPYVVDHYKIVLPRAKLLSKWPSVLKQFGISALWAIFGTFCIICVAVSFIDLFKNQTKDPTRDVLIIWGYFFDNINQKNKTKSGAPYRFLLINILFYVFIISCATQASLLSATTHPIRGDQPDIVKDVVSEYQLLVSPSLYSHVHSIPVIDLETANTTCRLTIECIMKVMSNPEERLFTIASDIYHRSYVWRFADENGELKIHTIREPVATLLQTMYLRRGSFLAQPFNKLLRRIRSAGLIDMYLDRLHFHERLKYKFHARRQKMPQTLKGLKSVYMVFIFGCGVSVITFVLECLRKE